MTPDIIMSLVVERPALDLVAGKLALTDPRPARITRQQGGQGFVAGARVGDTVSIHWNWACDVLNASALGRLQRATKRCLELSNQTI